MGTHNGPLRALALALVLVVVAGPATAAVRQPEPRSPHPVSAALADDRIADLAASLDYDVEKLFRFVADEIRYEPYVGILRGATGTLDSRAGNSVDQALLLGALLEESLITHRYARGTLDDLAATRLIDSTQLSADEARQLADAVLLGSFDETVTPDATGTEIDAVDLDGIRADARMTARRAGALISDAALRVKAALADAGIDLPGADLAMPRQELESHTWAQVASGAEWVDLDPALAGAEIGVRLAPVVETLDRLPDDLRYRVEFEVIVEVVRDGLLETVPVLDHVVFADDVAGSPIKFGHLSPSGVERLGGAISRALGEGEVRYFPYLETNKGSVVADEAVTFGSTALPGSEGGLLEDTDLFADMDPSAPGGPADGESTAEWLVVRITRPDSDSVTARRTIFDRLPPSIRYGGTARVASIEPVELVDVFGTGTPDFAPMLGIRSFAIATGTTGTSALAAYLSDSEPDVLGALAFAYHGLRDALVRDSLIPEGMSAFVNAPNVVSFALNVDASGREPVLRTGLDIWHRSLGVSRLLDTPQPAVDANVAAGIVAYVAEQLALDAGASGQDQDAASVGIGAVFDAASRAGIPTVVIQGGMPDVSPYGPTATYFIGRAVSAGDVVVIPAEPVVVDGRERVGWWRVNSTTGATTDVMDDGSGGSATEYPQQVSRSQRVGECFVRFVPELMGTLGTVIVVFSDEALMKTVVGVSHGATATLLSIFRALQQDIFAKALTICKTGRIPAP